ncbi:MAG: hypothetical protein OES09_13915 [Gammaproteobacteria bacterium]|nr:hypothetical protein [Gammaproteobacteria bacterium]
MIDNNHIYDVLIIGGSNAALCAATTEIYAHLAPENVCDAVNLFCRPGQASSRFGCHGRSNEDY